MSFGLARGLLSACLLFALPPAGVQAQTPPANQGDATTPELRYWTTSWSFKDMDLRNLTRRLASIGVELPVEISGTASVCLDVSVPVGALTDSKAYRFRGTLSSPRLQADKLVVEQFAANLQYSDGVLRLSQFRGQQADGIFEGSATADVASNGRFDAELRVQRLRLGPIVELMAKLGIGGQETLTTGRVDGDVQVSGSINQRNDIASWNLAGGLHVRDLKVGDSVPLTITMTDVELREGRLVVPSFGVSSSVLPDFYFKADADVQLTGSKKFFVAVQADDVPATDLCRLYFASNESLLQGKVDLQGTARGQLNPPGEQSSNLDVRVAVASPSVHILGIDFGVLEHRLTVGSDSMSLRPMHPSDSPEPFTIQRMDAQYQLNPGRLEVTQLRAAILGGTIRGTAVLARAAGGNHHIRLVWADLSPTIRLANPVASNSARLSAVTTGKVDWSMPAEKAEFLAAHHANIQVRTDSLRIDNEPLGRLDADVKIDQSRLDLRSWGQLFGGRVEWKSTSSLEPTARLADFPHWITSGQLLVSDVSIGKVVTALAQSNPLQVSGRLSGTTDLTIKSEIGAHSRWTLRDFGMHGHLLSRRLDADLTAAGSQIDMHSIHGGYAGGQLRASGRWALRSGSRIVDARIVQADADRILVPLSASADRWARGKFSGRGTIVGYGQQPWDVIHVSGAGRLTGGQSFGIPVGNAQARFRVRVHRKPLSWQADLSSVRSELAQGQVNGDLHFASARASRRGFDMESRWRVHHVDLEQLLRTHVGTKTVGRGIVTGQINLSGRKIRTPDALQGTFRVKLGGTDVTAVPGLSATSSLLGTASLVGTSFREGHAAGRIAGGAVGIDQLVLLSDRLKVISSGRVGLKDGRIDMMTIATTGNFRGQTRILQGIAPNALVSLSPVASLNQMVSNRTVVVDMTGTLRDPQIGLRPAETLQANLSELVIRQLVGQLAIESDVLDIDW